MKFLAAVLALGLAGPVLAAPAAKKAIPDEGVNLVVSVTVVGPGGALTTKSRVQAQSQFNISQSLKTKPQKLIFSGVPVINPNNGSARMEYKGRATWNGDEWIEFQSAYEAELGAEVTVYDTEGVWVKIKITAAE